MQTLQVQSLSELSGSIILHNTMETLQVMSFSSQGGTAVNGIIRPDKPAFLAPNGVNTTVNLGNGDWQKDDNKDGIVDADNPDPDTDIPNFFGTSAAAPHAAAVAALIIQAKKKFGGTSGLGTGTAPSPAEILNILKSSAINIGMPDVAGAGFIQANKAIGEFANPAPVISNLNVLGGGTPDNPFSSFTVLGDFFVPEEGPDADTAYATQIFFRDAQLPDANVDATNENTILVELMNF